MVVGILVIVILVSFLIVRIGGLALEMTGMEPSRARFQALSAFTGTGFTTQEAELVVTHPARRQIVIVLMILGNAGIVTVISTFVVSLLQRDAYRFTLNIILILAAVVLVWRLALSTRVAEMLKTRVQKRLLKNPRFQPLAFEYVLQQAKGYGIIRVAVEESSHLAGKTLSELGTTSKGVLVLSIEREGEVIPVPKARDKIQIGDALLCFGMLSQIREALALGEPAGEVG
jgi:hypothetical protein